MALYPRRSYQNKHPFGGGRDRLYESDSARVAAYRKRTGKKIFKCSCFAGDENLL